MFNFTSNNVSDSASTMAYTCWFIRRSTTIICYEYFRNYV